jgi:hypothetical protein
VLGVVGNQLVEPAALDDRLLADLRGVDDDVGEFDVM